ncbi:excalibur calcium-binding domain-containing protein [Microterricola viridarii]|nr:excalibur calcium-binding domain-containing protein [Microterricola viridarii]
MPRTTPPIPNEAETPRASFFTKPTTRRTAAFVSGGALLLGLIFGSSAAGASGSSEIAELKSELAQSEEASLGLAAELEQLESDHESISASEAKKTKTIAALQADAGTAATAAIAQAEKITALEAELAAAAAAVAAAAPPEPAPAPVADTPVTNTYFKNCTAVRNAGAAPIRAGDPGYGSHLDRDGDGVGCE